MFIRGRRRNLGTERWISYEVLFEERDGLATFVIGLDDDVGRCPVPRGGDEIDAGGDFPTPVPVYEVRVAQGEDAAELVRAEVCRLIDTRRIDPGVPRPRLTDQQRYNLIKAGGWPWDWPVARHVPPPEER
jgi:hypothetical protein